MGEANPKVVSIDPDWDQIREEANGIIDNEPVMASLVHSVILSHSTLEVALSHRIAHRLASGEMTESILYNAFEEAYDEGCRLGNIARSDILAVFERDPACHRYIQPLLFYKGFQAVQAYRLAHWFWVNGRKDLAYFMQMRTSEVFGVDIHPAAKVGRGLMIDHAHS
ncbi:MAG: serine O-acetyltransferase, partial [Amylibacter sp.]